MIEVRVGLLVKTEHHVDKADETQRGLPVRIQQLEQFISAALETAGILRLSMISGW